jgi:hypothetical protein
MYDELIKSLRDCAEVNSLSLYKRGLMKQAADAIEELIRKEKFHAFLWNTIQPNEMEQYISMYNSGNIPQKPPKEESYGV